MDTLTNEMGYAPPEKERGISGENRTESQKPRNNNEALDLINEGKIDDLVENLEQFTGLSQQLGEALVEGGFSDRVIDHFPSFTNLSADFVLDVCSWIDDELDEYAIEKAVQSVASIIPDEKRQFLEKVLVPLHDSSLVITAIVDNIDQFGDLSHQYIAEILLENNLAETLAFHLNSFKNLPNDVAERLIRLGKVRHVAENLRSFRDISEYSFLTLINHSHAFDIVEALEHFKPDVRHGIAKAFIDRESFYLLLNESSSGINHNLSQTKIAEILIEAHRFDELLESLDDFSELDHTWLANKLVEHGDFSTLLRNVQIMANVNLDAIINEANLVGWPRTQVWHLVGNIEVLPKANQKKLLFQIIQRGELGLTQKALTSFKDIVFNKALADRLLESGQGWLVVDFLKEFSGVVNVEKVFNDFLSLEPLQEEEARILAKRKRQLPFLLEDEVINAILGAGIHPAKSSESIVDFIGNFDTSHQELVQRIIEAGAGSVVVMLLERFKNIDHVTVIRQLLERGLEGLIAQNLAKFSGLDRLEPELLNRLRSGPHGKEGFKESDPNADNEYVLTSYVANTASVFRRFFNGDVDVEQMERWGFDEGSIENLKRIKGIIEAKYEEFEENLKNDPSIPEQDKRAFLYPENHGFAMVPFNITVNNLVCRYLALSNNTRRFKASDADQVEKVLRRSFNALFELYAKDIPAYDKLYTELDELRHNDRYPLEVYLGRDGVYAYIGRRAADVARRRKMGWKKRKELEAEGKLFAIKPKYLVFPTKFKNDLSFDVKREFLEAEAISYNADPIFFDTGFAGSIPEHIMRLLGFEETEIDSRIKLISAAKATRRVRGIDDDGRDRLVTTIEDRAKLEKSATGLIKDFETGEIKVEAEPSEPSRQFQYWMIEQVIVRHYWVKERYDHPESYPELAKLAEEQEEVAGALKETFHHR